MDDSVLLEYLGDDDALRREVLQQFLDTLTTDLLQLESELRERNVAAVQRSAHRLKGAAYMVGARPLGDSAMTLEQLARAGELAGYWENALHSLRGEPNVIDIRNIGLMGAVELAPRAGAPGARAFEAHVKAFFEEDLMIRFTGDIIAMSPPLIVQKTQIDQMIERLARVLRRLD